MNKTSILGAIFVSVFFVLVCCGCRNEEVAAEESNFKIAVDFDKNDKVYQASVAFYCDGEHCGSQSVINADGSVLDGKLYFTFIEADFPDGRIPNDFEFELFVTPESKGGSYPVSRSAGLQAIGKPKFGKTYSYSLKGDFKEGFGIFRNK